MFAAFRRPDTVVAAAAQSRARTPSTSSTGQEMTNAAGVGVFVAEEWIEKVFEVQRVSDNYFSETHSRPACGYLYVCVCPTEWSK